MHHRPVPARRFRPEDEPLPLRARAEGGYPAATMAAAYLALTAAIALDFSDTVLLNLFQNDSFFYIKTAANIAEGRGSTFDGINPTSGYHPLWILLLIGLAKLVPLHGFVPLRLLIVIHAVLVAGAALLMDRLLRRASTPAPWRLAALVVVLGLLGLNDVGLEAPVLRCLAGHSLR